MQFMGCRTMKDHIEFVELKKNISLYSLDSGGLLTR